VSETMAPPDAPRVDQVAVRLVMGSPEVQSLSEEYALTLAQAAECLVICGGNLQLCHAYIDRAIAFPIIRVFDTKDSPAQFKIGRHITIQERTSAVGATVAHDAIITKTSLDPVTGVLSVTAQDVVSFSARSVDGHLDVVDMVRKLWELDHA
jgi:hypothetical protein